jgi:hypothetical protein
MPGMSKILFAPFSALGGLLAGLVGKKVFAGLWSLFDKDQPPDPRQKDASWRKVILALVLQGAVFRVARGVVDRASRTAFSRATGAWPGEEKSEPKP